MVLEIQNMESILMTFYYDIASPNLQTPEKAVWERVILTK